MAQAELRPPSSINGCTRVRIKLKLPGAKRAPFAVPGGSTSSTGTVLQLAELHAAVEAFCQQGLHSLPGGVLLSPWREPSPEEQGQQQQHQEQQQQVVGSLPGEQQQHDQPARKRVRKRRAPDAAADGWEGEKLLWGAVKRPRSAHHRPIRDAKQLSNSIHSMMQLASAVTSAPASPSVVSQAPSASAAAAAPRSKPSMPGGKAGQQQSGTMPRSRLRPPSPPVVSQIAAVASAPPSAAEPAGVDAMDVDATPVNAAAAEGLKQQQQPLEQQSQQGLQAKQQRQQEQKQQLLRQQQEEKQKQQEQAQKLGQQQQELEPKQNQQQQEQQQPQEERQQQQQQVQRLHEQTQQQQQQLKGKQHKQQQQEEQILQQVDMQHVPESVNQQPAASDAAHQAAAAAVRDLSAPAAPPAAAAAVAAADAKPELPAAAEEVAKPESPPSETSHQQHIAAAAPQHLQQLLPSTSQPLPADELQQKAATLPVGELQQLQQQKQPEQTAVSRDRSQCSLPRGTDAARGPAAVSMPAPAAVPAALLAPAAAAAGSAGAGRLLELAPDAMTPAARALACLAAVPEVRQRCMPPEDRQVRTQEEALSYLATVMEKAKQLKHQGDKRHNMLGSWDVFGLSHYALSTVEFLLYWDTAIRLLNKLRAGSQPVDKLQQQISNLSSAQFLRQTGALSTMAMNICSNCKGPDVAKQALRMLLERLSAISNMRNLHNQRKQLEGHIRLLKTNGGSIGLGSSNGSNGGTMRVQQQQQQQQQAQQQARLPVQAQQRAAAAAAAGAAGSSSGKPPSPNGSSWSPAGQQQFNKRSPDDSNTSNQDRLQLPVGPEGPGAGPVGAGGVAASAGGGHGGYGQAERALLLAKSERHLMDSMQELLRMTDGMHQTVMRMQQFLESPDVLGSEHARAAALHISVLGLDAGMFSIPRVAAHTEAAVMCITKLLRSS